MLHTIYYRISNTVVKYHCVYGFRRFSSFFKVDRFSKYPKSIFTGKIKNWNSNFLDGKNHNVIAVGTITIHGIEKEIEVNGSIQKNNKNITIDSYFELIISDFEIKIPKLVRDKISKKVKVEVNINLKQK